MSAQAQVFLRFTGLNAILPVSDARADELARASRRELIRQGLRAITIERPGRPTIYRRLSRPKATAAPSRTRIRAPARTRVGYRRAPRRQSAHRSTAGPSDDDEGDGSDEGNAAELPVELIRPHPLSGKIYGDAADTQLVEGIREHGLIHPLIVTRRGDGSYVLISGHRRLEAVKALGWPTVPARVIEATPEQEAELIVEANRSREKSASQRLREAAALEPAYARRARERQRAGTSATSGAEAGRTSDHLAAAVGLGSGKQLERLQEIAKARPDLLDAIDAGRKTIGGAYGELRREKRQRENAAAAGSIVARADVLLGDARELLPTLEAERFGCILSDPPYGVSQDGVTRERAGTVPLSSNFGDWDCLSDEDAQALIEFCAPKFFRLLRPGGALYLFTGDLLLPYWTLALKRAGFSLPRPYLLAWVKPNPPPSVRKRGWRSALEPIIYALKPGPDTFNYLSDQEMANALTFGAPGGADRVHPTQKPIGLLKRLIQVSTLPGDEILDPFAGSGSTGEAALSLGRHALLIERDPVFHGLATRRIHQIESDIKARRCEP